MVLSTIFFPPVPILLLPDEIRNEWTNECTEMTLPKWTFVNSTHRSSIILSSFASYSSASKHLALWFINDVQRFYLISGLPKMSLEYALSSLTNGKNISGVSRDYYTEGIEINSMNSIASNDIQRIKKHASEREKERKTNACQWSRLWCSKFQNSLKINNLINKKKKK